VPIKLFIVTWQNEKALNDGLDSLFTNNNIDLEVNVIANHSAVKVHDEFQDKVNIIYNNLRLDESTGYLSRNWNQAILLGFKSLRNPGWGDNFCSYLPEAVKKVGLWDERFITTHHAAEYFYRMLIFNRKNSSINDHHHQRVLNPENIEIAGRLSNEKNWYLNDLINTLKASEKLLYKKFPSLKNTKGTWTTKQVFQNTNIGLESYMLYPYFEKDVETLQEQKYAP
jgi:hypothetical protein